MLTSWGIAVAVATPLLSFLAVLLGQRLTRRGALELDKWRRREETMRMLRWAAESVASEKSILAAAGFAVVSALGDSELLQKEDEALVDAVVQVASEVAYAGHDAQTYAEAQRVVATEPTSWKEAPDVDEA